MKKHRSVLSITVDMEGTIDARVDGDILSAYGAIDMAKTRLYDRLNEKYVDNTPEMTEPTQRMSDVKRMRKQEAIGVMLKVWKTMEARIQAMNNADEQAVFDIPSHLLFEIE